MRLCNAESRIDSFDRTHRVQLLQIDQTMAEIQTIIMQAVLHTFWSNEVLRFFMTTSRLSDKK